MFQHSWTSLSSKMVLRKVLMQFFIHVAKCFKESLLFSIIFIHILVLNLAELKCRSEVTGQRSQVTGHKPQAAGQVTDHRSQVRSQATGHTEKQYRTLEKTVPD